MTATHSPTPSPYSFEAGCIGVLMLTVACVRPVGGRDASLTLDDVRAALLWLAAFSWLSGFSAFGSFGFWLVLVSLSVCVCVRARGAILVQQQQPDPG